MSVSLMRCVSQRISESTSKTANMGLFIEAKCPIVGGLLYSSC